MKVACYVRPFYPLVGGLERIADLVTRQLGADGNEVTVYTETQLGPNCEIGDKRGVVRQAGFFALWRGFRSADVILFFGMSLRAMPAAILSGRAIVLSHHGVYEARGGFLGQVLRWFRVAITHAFTNISVSHFVARSIPGRSVVIHNAYDHTLFKLPSKDYRPYDFGFCGRLVSEKGADLLLGAFRLIHSRQPSCRLLMVGDGPERSALEQQVRENGLDGSVTFAGSVVGHDVAAAIAQCRVLVVPSNCPEAFGIVALEGLASGCAVVVTNVGGLPEAIDSFGLVAETNPESLRDAMLNALDIRLSNPTEFECSGLCHFLELHQAGRVGRRYERLLRLAFRTRSSVLGR